MGVLTILGQAVGPVFNFFGNKQAARDAAEAARNPANQRAAAEAQNQQILIAFFALIVLIIIAIALKKK